LYKFGIFQKGKIPNIYFGTISITKADDTSIQAVSPEFIAEGSNSPADAPAKETERRPIKPPSISKPKECLNKFGFNKLDICIF
jgi:hypothetical protein